MPSKGNLDIYQGDDYSAVVTVTDKSNVAVPLTGYTAQAQVRTGPADTNTQVVVEITCSMVLPNYVALHIAAADTICLSGTYAWDLQIISALGTITTIMVGSAIVTPEITRETTTVRRRMLVGHARS